MTKPSGEPTALERAGDALEAELARVLDALDVDAVVRLQHERLDRR